MSQDLRNQIESQAELHQILGNPSRLFILWSLLKAEMSVGEIATQIDASLQNTSQHLRLMKDKGVLQARRDGRTIFYHIAVSETGKRCRRMLACFENHTI
jgi:DNA-binding transcriptional ArsR family regulator